MNKRIAQIKDDISSAKGTPTDVSVYLIERYSPNLLFGLPDDLFSFIIIEFLTMTDICFLDTSINNVYYRRQFLECIGFGITLKGFTIYNRMTSVSCFNWMLLRRIDVESLWFVKNFFNTTNIHNLNSNQICHGISDCCPNINKLDLSHLNVDDQSLIIFTNNCLKIKIINISNCKQLTSLSLIALGKLHLNYINAQMCDLLFSDIDLNLFKECFLFLQKIDLSFIVINNENCFIHFFKCCGNTLQILNINHCNGLSEVIFINMIRCLPYIWCLNVRHCHNVTDLALIEMTNYCKFLNQLDVSNCQLITDESIIVISNTYENLLHLVVTNTAITELSLLAIAENCIHIEILLSTICTDKVIFAIAKHCKSIRILNFSISDHSEDCLIQLLMSCPLLNLNRIRVHDSCSMGYNDLSIILLMKRCDPYEKIWMPLVNIIF